MIEQVIAHLESNQQAHLDRLLDWLRIPSISTDPSQKPAMQQAAQWVQKVFTDCGIQSEILPTAGHPCVVADTGAGSGGSSHGEGPTLLVYGHYDVQPAGDELLWHSPPFEPTIRDGMIYARGSADDKGQIFTHMLAVESWMKVAGKVPARVKFLIEGEEEIGSPNLPDAIKRYRDRLACDYVALSDTPKLDRSTPAITYGTKGLIYKQINVSGPCQDLHSGSFGGSITNPGNALASIIASLRDSDNRVTIPGFYDDVKPLTDSERARIKELPFDEETYRKTTGSPSLHGEKGYSTLERRWARPTLDVNGMYGGFTGRGSSTIIPSKVFSKVSMRIVPDQDVDKVSQAFNEAVMKAAPPGVEVTVETYTSAAAYVAPLKSPGMTAAADAIEAGFGRKPVFIREGGTLPILPLFKEVLGADSLMLGFCLPNCNAHGPNEFFVVSDFYEGAKTSAYFMEALAGGWRTSAPSRIV